MADYGLTPQGPNIKRLDVILEEMHSGLSEKWGVNTRQNPESLLNHLLTNVADAIADLWEFGEADFLRDEPDNLSEYHGHERNQPYVVQSCLHQNRVPRNRECLHRSHQWRGVFL